MKFFFSSSSGPFSSRSDFLEKQKKRYIVLSLVLGEKHLVQFRKKTICFTNLSLLLHFWVFKNGFNLKFWVEFVAGDSNLGALGCYSSFGCNLVLVELFAELQLSWGIPVVPFIPLDLYLVCFILSFCFQGKRLLSRVVSFTSVLKIWWNWYRLFIQQRCV